MLLFKVVKLKLFNLVLGLIWYCYLFGELTCKICSKFWQIILPADEKITLSFLLFINQLVAHGNMKLGPFVDLTFNVDAASHLINYVFANAQSKSSSFNIQMLMLI